jgi:hypothetical protein
MVADDEAEDEDAEEVDVIYCREEEEAGEGVGDERQAVIKAQTSRKHGVLHAGRDEPDSSLANVMDVTDSSPSDGEVAPWDVAETEQCPLLHMHKLNMWDFPIFELSDSCGSDQILSKVSTV